MARLTDFHRQHCESYIIFLFFLKETGGAKAPTVIY
jgi:hypothetical protein